LGPSETSLELFVCRQKVPDVCTSLYEIAGLIFPPTTTDLVLESLHVSQSYGDIVAGSKVI
jgi:hypothetical protein